MPNPAAVAYEAYCESTGGKSLISGDPLPKWSELRPEIQKAWMAAAVAVMWYSASAPNNRSTFTRPNDQVAFTRPNDQVALDNYPNYSENDMGKYPDYSPSNMRPGVSD